MIRIGIDANGGDNGVLATVPGAIEAVKEFKDIEIVPQVGERMLENNK